MQEQLENIRAALAPYPWAYTATVIAALLLAAWLANWLTKRVLLRGLKRALRASPLGGAAHDHEAQQPQTIDFKSASAKNTRSA